VADLYASFGAVTFAAHARLVAGESLLAAGRMREGEMELGRALDFFHAVDAGFFVEKAGTLLAQRDSA
jgi:hypothetical protein